MNGQSFKAAMITGAAMGIGAFLGAAAVTFLLRLIKTEVPFIPLPPELQQGPLTLAQAQQQQTATTRP